MPDASVTTTCGYYGVSCRLQAHARDGQVASISPALDGPAKAGRACLKGRFGHQFSRHRATDVNMSCPEYKVIAVDVRPIGEEATMLPALERA